VNTSTKVLYMSLILLVAATLVTGCASRADAVAPRAGFAAPLSPYNELLAVDSLWSTDDRATGPAIRTPVDGPGRSRRLASQEYPNKGLRRGEPAPILSGGSAPVF
jgi:hypothetical protein